MRVNGVGSQGNGVGSVNRRDSTRRQGDTAPNVEGQADPKLRPTHGVLRLLQEGHFKGVADVRLRINFADEIAALQTTASNDGVASGDQPIVDAVKKVIDEFVNIDGITPETTEQVQNAFSDFQKAVQDLFGGFDASKDPNGSDLLDALGTAFNNFLQAIQALSPDAAAVDGVVVDVSVANLEITTPTEPATGDTTDTLERPAGSDFETFISDLTTAFEDAIRDLQDNLDSAQVLPPISEPNGNGKAYAKFLEILNGLTGGGDSQTTSGVDTAA